VLKLLDSHKHYCFHSPRCNVHTHPDLYRCDKGSAHGELMKANDAAADHPDRCTGAIHIDMARQAGLADDSGNVSCPLCAGTMTLLPGETKAELHVKLCTDETIHYPDMRKAGTITEEEFQAWKATLTRNELMGHYRRTPDIHVMASFTHDETALMTSDPAAFVALANARIAEQAEYVLLHQVPYRHQTTTPSISL
jgi:hypothetical protein